MNFFMPEMLASDELPIMVQAAGEDTDQDALVRRKGYPAYHAMLSVSGSGALETGSGCYDVPPGHAFMLAPNQPHSYRPTSDRWHTCWVVFLGAQADGIVSRLGLTMGLPFALSDTELFRQIYQRIGACARDNSIKGIYTASSCCYELLTGLSLDMGNQGVCESSGITHTRIAPVLEYVHVHYGTDMGLEQMAACIGVSPQHLCKLFQSTLAMSPCEYLLLYRLKKAKELLMDKALPTGRVGSLCGFRDPSYFCAVFKKHAGYTPKEFREVFGGA